MLIVDFFDVIEVLAGNAVNAAGLRNVLEKFCKFDYAQFAVNQFFLSGHDYLLFWIKQGVKSSSPCGKSANL
jgi:hypothetical protein